MKLLWHLFGPIVTAIRASIGKTRRPRPTAIEETLDDLRARFPFLSEEEIRAAFPPTKVKKCAVHGKSKPAGKKASPSEDSDSSESVDDDDRLHPADHDVASELDALRALWPFDDHPNCASTDIS